MRMKGLSLSDQPQKNTLPPEFRKYFWDCDVEQLRMEDHAVFITERILNFGNLPAVRWLLAVIEASFLREVVEHSRNLDQKTQNFWKMML